MMTSVNKPRPGLVQSTGLHEVIFLPLYSHSQHLPATYSWGTPGRVRRLNEFLILKHNLLLVSRFGVRRGCETEDKR